MNYRPSQSISDFVKKLKGRSYRKLQQEFPKLNRQYWGRHFWAIETLHTFVSFTRLSQLYQQISF